MVVSQTQVDDPLGWLVAPMARDEFLNGVMGRRHEVFRGPDDRFQSLLSLAELDQIFGSYGVRHPDIKLVAAERDVHASEYTWRDGLIDPMRAGRLFAEGCTVIFDGLHHRHASVQLLCGELSRQLNTRTQANIYLTPPKSQGFRTHYDSHDVLILQIEGTKQWRMYDGGPVAPFNADRFDPSRDAAGAESASLRLEPGDVLYIPRGQMHSASSDDVASVHITLGVIAYTWAELLTACISELADRQPEWRSELPIGFSQTAGREQVAAGLAERLASLQESIDLETVLTARLRDVDSQFRPPVQDILRQGLAASSVEDDDQVEVRPGLLLTLSQRDDRVIVTAAGRSVEFPTKVLPTLESILGGSPMRVGDIEGRLDAAGRNLVITTLVREGFLALRRQRTKLPDSKE